VLESRLAALLGGYVVLSTTALLVIRRALDVTRSPDESLMRTVLSPTVVLGGVLYAASFCVWLLALRRYPATTVYPLFVGAGFIGIALGGWLVLGESLGPMRVAGTAVVLTGIVLLTR
jgi:multidrug transporter EmrE-like cation transporter